MMYASLHRKFDPDRDAWPHPQILYVMAQKKAGAEYLLDISATRLSL
jgi:hypothetical protein